jgi:hypothetical protein
MHGLVEPAFAADPEIRFPSAPKPAAGKPFSVSCSTSMISV